MHTMIKRAAVHGSLFILAIGTAYAQFSSPPLPLPPNFTLSDDQFNSIGQVGYCIEQGGANSCTANDFSITSLTIINIDDACASPTDYMQVDMDVTYSKTQPIRYDVGSWFYRGSVSGTDFNTQTAITGDFCIRNEIGAGLITPGGEMTRDVDGDSCIDAPGTSGTISAETISNFILPCRDVEDTMGNAVPDGITDISACTSWNNNQNDQCDTAVYQEFDLNWPNSPSTTPGTIEVVPNTGSKCGCDEFDGGPLVVAIPNIGITKSCSPTELLPGQTTTCTITISNSGLGIMDGATSLGTEGFFYQDDYPENLGSVDTGSIMITSAGTTSVVDGFTINDSGMETTNRSLNIYPDDIAAGGSVVVVYDFVTSGSLPTTETDIVNTVCASYYDLATGEVPPTVEVSNYDDPAFGQCATDTVTTPITLAHFDARQNRIGQFEFDFSTATEVGNLGFNIYAVLGQTRYKLNQQIIPSKVVDSLTATDYKVTITSDLVGVADRFLVEDVDRFGRRSTTGEFRLWQKTGLDENTRPVAKTDWESIRLEHEALSNERQQTLRNGPASQAKATLTDSARPSRPSPLTSDISVKVDRDGVYRISHKDLLTLGVNLTGLDAADVKLTYRDQPIPVFLKLTGRGQTFDTGSYIEFIGEVQRSLYADHSNYLLEVGQGAALLVRQINAAPRGNQDVLTYDRTITVARDQVYSFASPIEGEPWFDTQLLAVSAPLTESIPIALPDLDPSGNARIDFHYWGGLDFPDEDLDHHIEFKLNDQLLGEDRFGGIIARNKRFELNPGQIVQEQSTVTLHIPADNANRIDLINLESISVTYRSALVAENGSLQFSGTGETMQLAGFDESGVTGYARTRDGVFRLRNIRSSYSRQTDNVRLSTLEGNAEYFISANSAVLNPALTLADTQSLDTISAPHLIIAHPDFINPDLVQYAQQTRSQYDIINTEDIYLAYSGGNRDAEAIRTFIQDVASRTELESILLVGGDSYDYHDNLGLGVISFVPTLYRATDELIQYSAVDALYADLDGDQIQDVGIGRLPVRTASELAVILQKSLQYRNLLGRRDAILTTDNTETLNAYDFVSVSNDIATMLNQEGWLVETAYLDDLPVQNARQSLLDAFNDGVRLAVYTGHSSSKRWTYDGLLFSTDVDLLQNANNPFGVVQWGCWNTYFAEPTEDSLGHRFMLGGNNGAALVIGASTLTDAQQESFYARIMHQKLLAPGVSAGTAMASAKQDYANQLGQDHADILLGISLLGDPVLGIQ